MTLSISSNFATLLSGNIVL